MNPNLLSEQYEYEDLAEYFSDYTVLDLQSNLLQLIQTNIVYSYCESLIINDLDCPKEQVANILKHCKAKNSSLLYSCLPFATLHKLKKVKDEVMNSDSTRYYIIDLILNLTVDNTMLYSTLAKFAYD